MKPIYCETVTIHSTDCDPYGRLKPSALLSLLQEAAGAHCEGTMVDWNTLSERNLFFAITRQHVQITRLPRHREQITIETWPCPATRVAYPRSTVCYDASGNELFRAMAIWVLMDTVKRTMVLPGKSGIGLPGTTRELLELPAPRSLAARQFSAQTRRHVNYTLLDRNLHMNNTRYLDWVMDLLPSQFHREHAISDFTVCYISEAWEGDCVDLHYELDPAGLLQVEATRPDPTDPQKSSRVFAVRAAFD